VSGQLTPGSASVISKATLFFGLIDLGTSTVYVVGDETAAVIDPWVQADWNMGILRLDQGAKSAYAYLSIEATPDGGGTLTIPFTYQASPGAPQQNAFRVMVYDATPTFIQDSLFVQTGDALGALIPEPGSTLTSLILVSDATGGLAWQPTAAALDPTANIAVGFEPITSGTTAFVELVVENIQEESSYVFATPDIP